MYLHDDAIYSISVDPTNDFLFASSCDDGTVQLFDLRLADPAEKLASSSSPFHSVMHNPVEPRIFVTANGRDGAQLWDVRVPNSPLLLYGASAGHRRKTSIRNPRQQACMFARFSSDGNRVLVLRRRLPPALYRVKLYKENRINNNDMDEGALFTKRRGENKIEEKNNNDNSNNDDDMDHGAR